MIVTIQNNAHYVRVVLSTCISSNLTAEISFNTFVRRHILCRSLNCSIVWRQKPLTRTMKYMNVSSWNMSVLRNVVADTSFTQPWYTVKSDASLTAVCTRFGKSICLVMVLFVDCLNMRFLCIKNLQYVSINCLIRCAANPAIYSTMSLSSSVMQTTSVFVVRDPAACTAMARSIRRRDIVAITDDGTPAVDRCVTNCLWYAAQIESLEFFREQLLNQATAASSSEIAIYNQYRLLHRTLMTQITSRYEQHVDSSLTL